MLDASVWIAAKDEDDRFNAAAWQLVTDTDRPLGALDLTFYEVANVLGARRSEPSIAREVSETISSRCRGRIVSVDVGLIEAALEIAAEHGLTAYDAAYVAAARRHDWTLISTDIADLVSKGLAVSPDAAV